MSKRKSEIREASQVMDWTSDPQEHHARLVDMAVEIRFRDLRWQIASKLAWELCSRGIRPEEFATECGIPFAELSLLLNGTWEGEMRVIAKIEVALGGYVLAVPDAYKMHLQRESEARGWKNNKPDREAR